jgi:hypothetical protein
VLGSGGVSGRRGRSRDRDVTVEALVQVVRRRTCKTGSIPQVGRTSALSWTASTALKVRARTPLTAAFCSQASVWGTWPGAIAWDEEDPHALPAPTRSLPEAIAGAWPPAPLGTGDRPKPASLVALHLLSDSAWDFHGDVGAARQADEQVDVVGIAGDDGYRADAAAFLGDRYDLRIGRRDVVAREL